MKTTIYCSEKIKTLDDLKQTSYCNAPPCNHRTFCGNCYEYKITIENNNIFKKAVNKFSYLSQMILAMEECGELISCISQFIRNRRSKTHLAEEIADVEIMCAQLREMIGDDIVDQEKTIKIKRLTELLKTSCISN